ncbi:MAG: LAGLIDADG homing endonuclease [Parcubacteria group bacterium GW2011_GWA2_47_8]|nr:MAG: LAGLIDADG homing endonuclease [Parcubacteria group bacterium GW2011_GWA2_47_8]OHB18261.1 MAG: hypothetical protein A2666_00640 [Parcubacteria group bacterium RIFCSPHIGHO2_01_FULL_47_10b]
MTNTPSFLSDHIQALILGSILGDGSLRLHKPYKNARFSFRHSVKQQDYFHWKVRQLKEISSEKNTWLQGVNGRDGYGGEKLRYQSRALESLTELYHLTHQKNQMVIRRKWLNLLTPLSLAVWWLDDGSIITNGRRGVLCTDSFSHEAQKLLKQYLEKVWNISVSIGKIRRYRESKEVTYYRLWIRSSEQLQKLLRIILPYVQVESMLPKVILLYSDSQLQQRWISEVSKFSGFSETVVEKYATAKKAKWKRFRK